MRTVRSTTVDGTDLNRPVQVSYLEKVVLNQLKTLTELSLTSGKDTADRIARADRKKPRRMCSAFKEQ